MTKTENFSQIEIKSSDELRKWLIAHHAQEESVWLVTFKKHVYGKYVSTGQVLDELLCFGWIDGIRRKLDADRTMQLISPRKAQHWARSYKDRAAKLESEGRMMEPGRQAIARSQELGLWDFMADVDALMVPQDLEKVLKDHPPAREVFESFGNASKRNILRWVKLAKTPETRARRIEKAAKLAAQGKKVPGM